MVMMPERMAKNIRDKNYMSSFMGKAIRLVDRRNGLTLGGMPVCRAAHGASFPANLSEIGFQE